MNGLAVIDCFENQMHTRLNHNFIMLWLCAATEIWAYASISRPLIAMTANFSFAAKFWVFLTFEGPVKVLIGKG